jgi:hypothetical protein
VGEADVGGDASSIVKIVDRAARAKCVAVPAGLIVQLHRETDHVVSLLRQERGGHRGIDSAGHGDDYPHPLTASSR